MTRPTTHPRQRSKAARRRRRLGFTLTELMVAVTGGMFVTVAVFGLARHGSRFFQREARIASATMTNMIGFERLRADVARAGHLSTPNVQRDPFVCSKPQGTWPLEATRLAAVRIVPGGSTDRPPLTANGLDPDQIFLSGSYSTAEQFPVRDVAPSGGGFNVWLKVESGAMARIGGPTQLAQIFAAGRMLRVLDTQGNQHFGSITGVDTTNPLQPFITLASAPAPIFRDNAGTNACGIIAQCGECVASVINLIKYDVRNLNDDSNFGGANANWAPLYNAAATGPFDDDRTELVRVEIDTSTGAFMAGTEEVVAEYAVDLGFGITVASAVSPNGDPTLLHLADGNGQIPAWVGDVTTLGVGFGPQRVRTVTTRLSIRSREADRRANITPAPGIGPGLYRMSLDAAATQWARVRTIQAEIALHNNWQEQW